MSRYKLERSKTDDGYWVLTDTQYLVTLKFKEHEYNETQKVTAIDPELIKDLSPVELAKIMSGMGDWIYDHYYSVALPTPVYELRKDDKENQYLIRNKSPKFTLRMDESCTIRQLAASLNKAAAFLRSIDRRFDEPDEE